MSCLRAVGVQGGGRVVVSGGNCPGGGVFHHNRPPAYPERWEGALQEQVVWGTHCSRNRRRWVCINAVRRRSVGGERRGGWCVE